MVLDTRWLDDSVVKSTDVSVGTSTEKWASTTIRSYIEEKALLLGVKKELALYIAEHESRFNPDEIGDMDIICKKRDSTNYGRPVRARGVFQITDCYWPHITDEQAFDARFNIDLALPLLKDKETCLVQFTTCRWYYGIK